MNTWLKSEYLKDLVGDMMVLTFMEEDYLLENY
jgi:hypothetical protein